VEDGDDSNGAVALVHITSQENGACGEPGTLESSEATNLASASPFTVRPKWRRLRCGHQFHEECLFKWLKKAKKCPTCRCHMRHAPALRAVPSTCGGAAPASRTAVRDGLGSSIAVTSNDTTSETGVVNSLRNEVCPAGARAIRADSSQSTSSGSS
jgi:hypothetical protein